MSKNNNVNPGQYRVAGRERMGDSPGQEKSTQVLAKAREAQKPRTNAGKKR